MSLYLELKKTGRTGLKPAFAAGGLLAAAIPLLNMAVRSEIFTGLPGTPLHILLEANWQMMVMLNSLLLIAGACIMYNMEYADHAILKMRSLPIQENSIFLGKAAVLCILLVMVLTAEAVSLAFCSLHWFGMYDGFWADLAKNMGYSLILALPGLLLSLMIASACRNMWISLGIGVICVFMVSVLPAADTVLSLFPFAMPYKIFSKMEPAAAIRFLAAACVEIVGIGLAEILFLNLRRSWE